jgi:hypothetical protein
MAGTEARGPWEGYEIRNPSGNMISADFIGALETLVTL